MTFSLASGGDFALIGYPKDGVHSKFNVSTHARGMPIHKSAYNSTGSADPLCKWVMLSTEMVRALNYRRQMRSF